MHIDWRRFTWPLGAVLSIAIVTSVHAQDSGGLLSSLGSLFTSNPTTSGSSVASSSLLSQQQSVVASNIQQNAAQCATGSQPGTVGYAIQQAQNVHLQLASVRPNTDQLFSMGNNCFSGLSQLFDLSDAIPSLSSIIGAAAGAVAQYAKQQVCQAVNGVTSSVTTPLNQAISGVTGTVNTAGINGMIGQQMYGVDPNLGSAWNTNAPAGSYSINTNAFGTNQSSFSSASGTGSATSPVQVGTSSSGVSVMSGTGVSVSPTPPAPQPQPPTSVLGRLQNLIH